jgi:cytochrome c-type biogenesis protein CcmH/NrfG
MPIVYILFIVMLIATGIIVVSAFVKHKKKHLKKIFVTLFLMFSFIFFIFSSTGGTHQLYGWVNGGKQHYALLKQMQNLGGLDGMIAKLTKQIDADPQNAQAWMILGKLYLFKNDKTLALNAFKKAQELAPNNAENNKNIEILMKNN